MSDEGALMGEPLQLNLEYAEITTTTTRARAMLDMLTSDGFQYLYEDILSATSQDIMDMVDEGAVNRETLEQFMVLEGAHMIITRMLSLGSQIQESLDNHSQK